MRTLTKVINFISAIFLCIGLIWLNVSTDTFVGKIQMTTEGNQGKILFVLAVAVLILNLYNLYRCMQIMRYRQRAIEVDGKNGASSISIDAIQRRILEILTKAEDVSSPRVALEITGKGKPIKCAMEFCLQSNSNITGRADELKQVVREAFVRLIPGGPGIEISASVLDLANVKNASGSISDSSNFSGPVYPTGDDESNQSS